jgi:hypothetical protein
MTFYKLSCYTSLLPSVCTWSFDFFNDGVVEFQEIFYCYNWSEKYFIIIIIIIIICQGDAKMITLHKDGEKILLN